MAHGLRGGGVFVGGAGAPGGGGGWRARAGLGAAAVSVSVSRRETRRGAGLGCRLGFGPVGALRELLLLFLNNFAEPKKNCRKINKNPKMPKQIFTV